MSLKPSRRRQTFLTTFLRREGNRLRKNIPTITRSDPTYSAALRQDGRDPPGKTEEQAGVIAKPTTRPEPVMPPSDTRTEGTKVSHAGIAKSMDHGSAAKSPAPTRSKTSTRKIDIRVNALERQEAALEACGVEPAHVIRAALRRAVKGWHLSPVLAPVAEERRTRNTRWQARTSLAIDSTSLNVLLRDHDPLAVLSKWALIRGQLEPRIWDEIDTILNEIADRAASPQEADAP